MRPIAPANPSALFAAIAEMLLIVGLHGGRASGELTRLHHLKWLSQSSDPEDSMSAIIAHMSIRSIAYLLEHVQTCTHCTQMHRSAPIHLFMDPLVKLTQQIAELDRLLLQLSRGSWQASHRRGRCAHLWE